MNSTRTPGSTMQVGRPFFVGSPEMHRNVLKTFGVNFRDSLSFMFQFETMEVYITSPWNPWNPIGIITE